MRRNAALTRSAEGRIEIGTTPERVWRALTEARELERWFSLEAQVEPGLGGSVRLSWKDEFTDTSKIILWDPPRRLGVESAANAGAPTLVTDYFVEGAGGRTRLRVVTSGFPQGETWDGWVEGTRTGWRWELASLRHYLTFHDGRDREVLDLRRRVCMHPDRAWERLLGLSAGLPGNCVDSVPLRQQTVALDEPPGGLLRITLVPAAPHSPEHDVTLFLAVWGDESSRLRELEAEYAEHLASTFS